MLQSHMVHLNDVDLHYVEAPGAGPPLVIVHGLTGSHDEFVHLAPELARHAHLYLLDMRGHGRSGHTSNGYLYADYGRDLAAFLQHVVGQPAIVLGHSLGALAATWVAVNEPGLLRALIFEDPALYIVQMPRFSQSSVYLYFTRLHDYLRRYQANGAVLEEMIAYVGHTPADAERTLLEVAGLEAVRQRALQLHQVDPAVLEPVLPGEVLGHDQPDELLAQIDCPVHLLAADPALWSTLEDPELQRVVAQIPHCTSMRVENAGHDIHLDQPQVFLQEVTWFVRRVQGGS